MNHWISSVLDTMTFSMMCGSKMLLMGVAVFISNWELEEISSVSVFPDESFVIRYNSTLNALPNRRTEQYSFRISAWALNKEKFDEQRKGKIIFLTIFSLSRCKGSLCLKFIRIYSGHSALQGANFFKNWLTIWQILKIFWKVLILFEEPHFCPFSQISLLLT